MGNDSNPVTLHKYLYAGNDPVMMVDPSGNNFNIISLSAGAGIAGILATISTPKYLSGATSFSADGLFSEGNYLSQLHLLVQVIMYQRSFRSMYHIEAMVSGDSGQDSTSSTNGSAAAAGGAPNGDPDDDDENKGNGGLVEGKPSIPNGSKMLRRDSRTVNSPQF